MHIYIHIGCPKTGSSAIQWHVFTNRKWFGDRGIYIPDAGYAGALGHAFLFDEKHSPLPVGKTSPLPAGVSQLDSLKKELEVAGNDGFASTLLTWEGFSKLGEAGIQELAEQLRSHTVTVLAYVREQSALYQSATLQAMESLNSLSPDRLFGAGYKGLQSLETYDFHQVMTHWQKAFGERCSVRTRLFERVLLVDENVVSDFINWIQLRPDEEFWMHSDKVNQSLDVKGAILLLIARSTGANRYQLMGLSRSLTQLSSAGGEKDKFFLEEEDLAYFTARYAQSNRDLFDEFRPENAPKELTNFEDPLNTQKEALSPQAKYVRAVYDALERPDLETWAGSPLGGHRVGVIAQAPNTGWRGPEAKGEWSIGGVSTLDFRVPSMHPSVGPIAIKITISGTYFGSNTQTTVIVNGVKSKIDLSQAELSVSMDSITEAQCVKIKLEHDSPALASSPDEINTEKGIAFMLQFMSYTLVWG